jgi:soluble lytic murein transglycosylase-like protein
VIATLFVTFSLQYGLPPKLLSSLCYVESKHNINAINYDDNGEDSIGICQVKWSTAKSLGYEGSYHDLYDPHNNIKYAAMFLAKQIKRYRNVNRGVIAYNRGNAKNLTSSRYQIKVIKEWRRECKKHRSLKKATK